MQYLKLNSIFTSTLRMPINDHDIISNLRITKTSHGIKHAVALTFHTWIESYSYERGPFAFYISMLFGLQFTVLNREVQPDTPLCEMAGAR